MKLSSIAKIDMRSANHETSMHIECDIPLIFESLEKPVENIVAWVAKCNSIHDYTVEFRLHVDYNVTENILDAEINIYVLPIDQNDDRLGFDVIDIELSEDEKTMVKTYALKNSTALVI